LIDPTQARHSHALTKLVQHAYVRDPMAAGQMGELTPSPLLGQHLDDQIDRMRRSQQHQQMNSPQLGRVEFSVTSSGASVRPLFAKKFIGNKRREFVQKCVRASSRKQAIHVGNTTPKNPLRPHFRNHLIFSLQPTSLEKLTKTFVTPSKRLNR
jgi:hypothetical protein